MKKLQDTFSAFYEHLFVIMSPCIIQPIKNYCSTNLLGNIPRSNVEQKKQDT